MFRSPNTREQRASGLDPQAAELVRDTRLAIGRHPVCLSGSKQREEPRP